MKYVKYVIGAVTLILAISTVTKLAYFCVACLFVFSGGMLEHLFKKVGLLHMFFPMGLCTASTSQGFV